MGRRERQAHTLGYWVRSLEALGDDVEMPAGDLLSEVHDSEFQEWIHRESAYGYEVGTVRHFCLMGYNDFVDVLAYAEPRVELQYVSTPKQEGEENSRAVWGRGEL